MGFFRVTGIEGDREVYSTVEATSFEAVLKRFSPESTVRIEELDPDSNEVLAALSRDGGSYRNPATREIPLTNSEVCVRVPLEHFGRLSQYEWRDHRRHDHHLDQWPRDWNDGIWPKTQA